MHGTRAQGQKKWYTDAKLADAAKTGHDKSPGECDVAGIADRGEDPIFPTMSAEVELRAESMAIEQAGSRPLSNFRPANCSELCRIAASQQRYATMANRRLELGENREGSAVEQKLLEKFSMKRPRFADDIPGREPNSQGEVAGVALGKGARHHWNAATSPIVTHFRARCPDAKDKAETIASLFTVGTSGPGHIHTAMHDVWKRFCTRVMPSKIPCLGKDVNKPIPMKHKFCFCANRCLDDDKGVCTIVCRDNIQKCTRQNFQRGPKRQPLELGQVVLQLIGTAPVWTDEGELHVPQDAEPSHCKWMLITGVLMSPWENRYAELTLLEADSLDIARLVRRGQPHPENLPARATHTFMTEWDCPDTLAPDLRWEAAVWGVQFTDELLGRFVPNYLNISRDPSRNQLWLIWCPLLGAATGRAKKQRSPFAEAFRVFKDIVNGQGQDLSCIADGEVEAEDVGAGDDHEGSDNEHEEEAEADNESNEESGSEEEVEDEDNEEEHEAHIPENFPPAGGGGDGNEGPLPNEDVEGADMDSAPRDPGPAIRLDPIPSVSKVEIPGIGEIVWMPRPNAFQARCRHLAHTDERACNRARQAYVKAGKSGSGRPLGFLMCWLEAQHEYDSQYGHVNDPDFDPPFDARDSARNRLMQLPGATDLQSHEAPGPGFGSEPLDFNPRR